MNKYIWNPNNYIWLSGFGFVQGWIPEELNKFIDKWNNEICNYVSNCTFFNWLSYETGNNYNGIACCNKNNNFHTIKAAKQENE